MGGLFVTAPARAFRADSLFPGTQIRWHRGASTRVRVLEAINLSLGVLAPLASLLRHISGWGATLRDLRAFLGEGLTAAPARRKGGGCRWNGSHRSARLFSFESFLGATPGSYQKSLTYSGKFIRQSRSLRDTREVFFLPCLDYSSRIAAFTLASRSGGTSAMP